jgi:hypothetical protein
MGLSKKMLHDAGWGGSFLDNFFNNPKKIGGPFSKFKPLFKLKKTIKNLAFSKGIICKLRIFNELCTNSGTVGKIKNFKK